MNVCMKQWTIVMSQRSSSWIYICSAGQHEPLTVGVNYKYSIESRVGMHVDERIFPTKLWQVIRAAKVTMGMREQWASRETKEIWEVKRASKESRESKVQEKVQMQ